MKQLNPARALLIILSLFLAACASVETRSGVADRQSTEEFSLGAQVSWELDIWGKLARIVEVQYKNGLADAQDLALSKSDLALARSQLEEVQLARRDAVRALELLLGRYPGADLEIAATLPRLPPPPPAGLPSELLERRPDVLTVQQRVAARKSQSIHNQRLQLEQRIKLYLALGGEW